MKKKILGIFVCVLMISTTFSVLGTNINNKSAINADELDPPQISPLLWLGVDQKQDKTCNSGYPITPPIWYAQEFKPSKEKLIGVKLWMFKHGNPPANLNITVSIRDSLNGNDLSVTTVDADPIKRNGTWVLFDFNDITVTPENTYYILCRGGGGNGTDVYCWLFNVNNSYDRGNAWQSFDDGITWLSMEDIDPNHPKVDFCFKTYSSKSKARAFVFDMNLFGLLFKRSLDIFSLLKHIQRY